MTIKHTGVIVDRILYAALLDLYMEVADQADGAGLSIQRILDVYRAHEADPPVRALYQLLLSARTTRLI